MNWKEYLKTQGYTDSEIANMATTFGEDKMSKAFADPIQKLAQAQARFTEAEAKDAEFRTFYETEVMPKISTVYQDAINMRTQNAALTERLKAASDYGFLSEVPGSPAPPVVPGIPGSPAPVAAPAAVPGSPAPPDSRYLLADEFKKSIDNVPDMLARMQNVALQHATLFGNSNLDMTELVNEARAKKTNIQAIWEQKYNVPAKRKEIADAAQAAHDKEVGDNAIRKYASEHNMPFTAPGVPSTASMFTPTASRTAEDMHQPWKGARERKAERKQKFMDAMFNRGPAAGVRTQ